MIDEADRTGAILLVEDADELFNKRSAVKDSHDRYANQEVSYLLDLAGSRGIIAILIGLLVLMFDDAAKTERCAFTKYDHNHTDGHHPNTNHRASLLDILVKKIGLDCFGERWRGLRKNKHFLKAETGKTKEVSNYALLVDLLQVCRISNLSCLTQPQHSSSFPRMKAL